MLTGFYFMFTRFNECIIYYGPTNLHLCTCSQESNCCELFSPSGTIHKHSFWSISHFRGSVSRTFHCSEENRMAEWWEEQKVEHILALYLCDSFDYRGIWNRSIETPLIEHWFLRPKEGSSSALRKAVLILFYCKKHSFHRNSSFIWSPHSFKASVLIFTHLLSLPRTWKTVNTASLQPSPTIYLFSSPFALVAKQQRKCKSVRV